VAKNRAIDRLRRQRRGAELLEEAAALGGEGTTMHEHDTGTGSDADFDSGSGSDESEIEDDRLRLIFTCCHPALALDARVALTLRTLAGLTTAEIARAFLVPEATMAKRLVRAKGKIAGARIPYRVPPAHLLPERTGGVLAVLYLLFNEGYSASGGPELIRAQLCDEAIRLARALSRLMPDEPEAAGLLALMLLHHSHRHARLDAAGDLITLEDQDRALWDRAEIEEANARLQAALRHGRAGPYQLQAAIAACHTDAAGFAETDWAQIARLYELLAEVMPSPVVALNRAVAIAMDRGPERGLEVIDALEASGELARYHLLHATRADLLRRLGRPGEAAEAYRRALDLARSDAERRFLRRRLAEVAEPEPAS
jgi:RNA polymerase sigma-70 factor, ECF subfamily